MSDWNIKSPLGECCGSGRKIADNEAYYAALVDTDEGLQRRDFSCEFWIENQPRVYCYWKTKFSAARSKRPLFIDDDMLMAFFERLATDTEPERVNFRFVLALVLMRKRRLKYDSSTSGQDKEVWRLRVSGEKRLVEVANPNLSQEQIERLTEEIGQILQVEMSQD